MLVLFLTAFCINAVISCGQEEAGSQTTEIEPIFSLKPPIELKDIEASLKCMNKNVSENDVVAHYKKNRDISSSLDSIHMISYFICKATEDNNIAICDKLKNVVPDGDPVGQCKLWYLLYKNIYPMIRQGVTVEGALKEMFGRDSSSDSGQSEGASDLYVTITMLESIALRDEEGCKKLPETEMIICKAIIEDDVSLCKSFPESGHQKENERVCEENTIAINAYIKNDGRKIKELPLVGYYVAGTFPVRYHFNKNYCDYFFDKVLKVDYCTAEYEPRQPKSIDKGTEQPNN